MKTFDYTVKDELGIHARPAGLLVKEAKNFTSKITIKKGEKEVHKPSMKKQYVSSPNCTFTIACAPTRVLPLGAWKDVSRFSTKNFWM